MVLESDQIVAVGPQVFLAQLDRRVGPATGSRIIESGCLHWTEAQRVAAASCDLFDRQTSLKVRAFVLGDVRAVVFRRKQGIDEGVILVPVHRTVNVIISP